MIQQGPQIRIDLFVGHVEKIVEVPLIVSDLFGLKSETINKGFRCLLGKY